MPAEDIKHPEKQPIVFERRQKKIEKTKRATKEVGMEFCPWKGVLKREVSKHQETLIAESMASLGTTEGNITVRKNK